MDEYSALAQRVAMTMDDVRGCLVLSRDGLVLGAFPEESETAMKPAWLRFVNVGEARRSFVEFGDQIWAYIFRGPYAAFVVSGTAVRPGVLLDQLEMALLTAEEARQKRDTLRVPEAPGAPSGKPRTSLHPPATDRPPVEVAAELSVASLSAETAAVPSMEIALRAEAAEVPEGIDVAPVQEPVAGPPSPFASFATSLAAREVAASDPTVDAVVEPSAGAAAPAETPAPAVGPVGESPTPSSFPRATQRLVTSAGTEESSEIDRVMLAKEFGGLLQADSDADEASS
jgi:hypothetical protein